MAAYTSSPLSVPAHEGNTPFQRADLKFYGVDHSGSSFEARIFLNNPAADETTARSDETGYAGSFYIFGHGRCFGDEGHCRVRGPVSPFDRRPPHQLTPTTKTVIVTDQLRKLCGSRTEGITFTVTMVPVVRESALASADDAATILKFDRIALLTYD